MKKIFIILTILGFLGLDLNAARIKDIAQIEGFGTVQVIGYGLVTGLNNTGDNQMSSFTVQSVTNMLKRFGLTVPQTNPRVRNVAAVMVTANMQSFSKKGSKVDILVSSIGDASSLQGGVLVMTPMSTSDGNVIGFAQGALSVGGYDFQSGGSRAGKNFVTAGRIPNGLVLDLPSVSSFVTNQKIRVTLREPDFTTSTRVATAINASAGLANAAVSIDPATVEITLPAGTQANQYTTLVAQIEGLAIQSDAVAKVVINERTGTVVVGGNVQLLPAVVAHGGLEISIQKNYVAPQLPAFPTSIGGMNNPIMGGGLGNMYGYPLGINYDFLIRKMKEVYNIFAKEEKNEAVALMPTGNSVQNMADALNTLKVSPRDLISIFQALKEAGSLQGELVIQ
jgi:flagellar P-ring protein precursor FlgI